MERSWIVLQHVAWEGPGLIAVEAESRGLRLDVRRLDRGDRIPSSDHVSGLIVMGGPIGVHETDKHPSLAGEYRLIAELIRRNRPVLGVCLGAQLLAAAPGARVYPAQEAEAGFGSVELTPEGKQDFLFTPFGGPVPVFHWHGDTFDLPEGAVLLGTCAYGLQFHAEPGSEIWSGWREHLPKQLAGEDDLRRNQLAVLGRGLIPKFFDIALSPGISHAGNGQ